VQETLDKISPAFKGRIKKYTATKRTRSAVKLKRMYKYTVLEKTV